MDLVEQGLQSIRNKLVEDDEESFDADDDNDDDDLPINRRDLVEMDSNGGLGQ